ncbi:MAG: RING finger domain-containing protein [Candidatus Caldarchaeum sp.]|nr:RING finger domain-containing protein [Candidatus Caldarchaeum sp.]
MVREVNAGYWNPFETVAEKKQKASLCVICGLELLNDKTYNCPHCEAVGHMNCFDDWLSIKKSCPLCRRPIVEE